MKTTNKTNTKQHTEREIAKFDALAGDFWNRDGEFKTLHQINPIRVKFIEEFMTLSGKRVVDIGCGGGILAEALDEKDALVTAIDLSEVGIQTAKAHQKISGSTVDYRVQSVEDYADEVVNTGLLDGVFCMEMLEHVNNPAEIINDCSKMLKPGGIAVFSTLNRTKKAHLLAVIFAEYIARMVPQGTHDHKLFIKPSEMMHMAEAAGMEALDIIGFEYRPLSGDFIKSRNTDINYIFAFRKK